MPLVWLHPKDEREQFAMFHGLRVSGYVPHPAPAPENIGAPIDWKLRARTVRVYPPKYDSEAKGPESRETNESKGEISEDDENEQPADGSCPKLG
jgi:hypothetical protein